MSNQSDTAAVPVAPKLISRVGMAQIEWADALSRYGTWPAPTVIISDGAYGLNGFEGDPHTPADLGQWYAPHIAAWSVAALPETTLWFWNTEIGWATVHPLLEKQGWVYRGLHVWDKSVAHIAGNVNGKTIRRFPVVTEVCAQYVREVKLPTLTGTPLPLQAWLRFEWERTGLPLYKTNEACGVKNAASRKYFTKDHLWYFPPPEMIDRLSAYANRFGKPTHWPYFSINGQQPITGAGWAKLRAKWNHIHGITNVWTENALRGKERLKESAKVVHLNQKPLRLMQLLVESASDPGDVVWEPFGGLCSVAVVANQLGRYSYSAEIQRKHYDLAIERLRAAYVLQQTTPLVAVQLF